MSCYSILDNCFFVVGFFCKCFHLIKHTKSLLSSLCRVLSTGVFFSAAVAVGHRVKATLAFTKVCVFLYFSPRCPGYQDMYNMQGVPGSEQHTAKSVDCYWSSDQGKISQFLNVLNNNQQGGSKETKVGFRIS